MSARHIFFLIIFLAAACDASNGRTPITVDELINSPEEYLDKSNLIEACLNVTRHGMTLVQCGKISDQIIFEADEGANAEYDRILKTGFKHYGSNADDIRIHLVARFEQVEGFPQNYRLRIERVVKIQINNKGDEEL